MAKELGSTVEVFSFHSVSKGVTGECGLRGGMLHCYNVHPLVIEQMYKLASISLCSNVLGQALMASIVHAPPEGAPSRAVFDQESVASDGLELVESLPRNDVRDGPRAQMQHTVCCAFARSAPARPRGPKPG